MGAIQGAINQALGSAASLARKQANEQAKAKVDERFEQKSEIENRKIALREAYAAQRERSLDIKQYQAKTERKNVNLEAKKYKESKVNADETKE